MLNSTKAEGPKAEGPNISSDLKWNCHVSEIASYADALEMCDLPFLYDCRHSNNKAFRRNMLRPKSQATPFTA